jgi:hypothetical protein
MKSLKEMAPPIASALDLTDALVYERQRVLFQAGVLEGKAGKGPGSGVRATPENVATLLIAILVSVDGPAKVAARTQAVMRYKTHGRCELTGKRTLGEALASVLAMDTLPKVLWLQLSRQRGRALLSYTAKAKAGKTWFFGPDKTKDGVNDPVGPVIDVNLYRGLHEVAAALRG